MSKHENSNLIYFSVGFGQVTPKSIYNIDISRQESKPFWINIYHKQSEILLNNLSPRRSHDAFSLSFI